MDENLKKMISNVMLEDYNVKQVRFKEVEDDSYKILGLVDGRYKYLCTVTKDGDIIEYKEPTK